MERPSVFKLVRRGKGLHRAGVGGVLEEDAVLDENCPKPRGFRKGGEKKQGSELGVEQIWRGVGGRSKEEGKRNRWGKNLSGQRRRAVPAAARAGGAASCAARGLARECCGGPDQRVSLRLSRACLGPLPELRAGPAAEARGERPRSPYPSSVYRASRPVHTRPGSCGPAPAPALLGHTRPARRLFATACALHPGRAVAALPIGPNSYKPA